MLLYQNDTDESAHLYSIKSVIGISQLSAFDLEEM